MDQTNRAPWDLVCNLFNSLFQYVSLMCAKVHWSCQAQVRDAINGRREGGSYPRTALVDGFVTLKVH